MGCACSTEAPVSPDRQRLSVSSTTGLPPSGLPTQSAAARNPLKEDPHAASALGQPIPGDDAFHPDAALELASRTAVVEAGAKAAKHDASVRASMRRHRSASLGSGHFAERPTPQVSGARFADAVSIAKANGMTERVDQFDAAPPSAKRLAASTSACAAWLQEIAPAS